MGKWLLVFVITPLVEMYILIEVGGIIGSWPTIALVVLTAVIGVGLIRAQGFATLMRGMARLNAGELPATEMVEGVMLALAGALMVTPGFLTDTAGFILLTPRVRRRLAAELLRRFVPVAGADSDKLDGRTIEGRFRRH